MLGRESSWWGWGRRSRRAIVHADKRAGDSLTRCHSRPAVLSGRNKSGRACGEEGGRGRKCTCRWRESPKRDESRYAANGFYASHSGTEEPGNAELARSLTRRVNKRSRPETSGTFEKLSCKYIARLVNQSAVNSSARMPAFSRRKVDPYVSNAYGSSIVFLFSSTRRPPCC